MAIDALTMQDLWNKDTDGYIPVLLEIYNPDIKWTDEEKSAYGQENGFLRVISDQSRVIYKGKTWLPCSFEFTQPETDGTKIGSASISISALDARVKRLLKSISISSTIRIIATFAKTEKSEGKFIYKFIEINSMDMEMTAAGRNDMTASFNLTFGNAGSQNVPYDMATQDRTPAVNDSN